MKRDWGVYNNTARTSSRHFQPSLSPCNPPSPTSNAMGLAYSGHPHSIPGEGEDNMPDVYLLHFNRPYWCNAQHYIGYTKFTAEEHIATHRAGNGSKLVAYALAHGINFKCVLIEHFETCAKARERENQLKARHGPHGLCSICKGKINMPFPVISLDISPDFPL